MAGTFTNARALNKSYPCVVNNGNGFPDATDITIAPGSQLTTSYRTGRKQEESEILEEWLKVTDSGYQPKLARITDSGHEFYTIRKESLLTVRDLDLGSYIHPQTGLTVKFRGYVSPGVVGQVTNVYPTVVPMTNAEVLNLGSKAIANTTPTNPASHVAQTVGELFTEGLPHLLAGIPTLATRAAVLREAGGDYLNVTFGWIPFINDLRQICLAVLDANRIIQQYNRDSGRWVRRKYHFPDEYSSTSILVGSGICTPVNLSRSNWQRFFLSPGLDAADCFRHDTLSKRTWFSGAYTYYLNKGSSSIDNLLQVEEKINHLFGTRLTPDVIWEITPWTWLLDWFMNASEALSNFTRFQSDSLVLRYGYLMRETIATRVYTMGPLYLKKGGTIAPARVFRVTQKERRRATPYGFAIDVEAFTPQRIATLIALGFTKTPNGWR
jgi:hypothetical protein